MGVITRFPVLTTSPFAHGSSMRSNYCPACRALCPDVTDLSRFRRRSMLEFLRELCGYIKQINASIQTTVVLHPHDISLAEDLAGIEVLDTIGCHLFWDMLQADVTQVELWGRQILDSTRGTTKRSQLWLQNFNINERNAEAMETAFSGILSLEPGEIGCFYFWRNNANPVQVWDTTRRLLKRVPRRQLYWRMYTSPLPAPRPMNLTLPSRDRLVPKAPTTPAAALPESALSALANIARQPAPTEPRLKAVTPEAETASSEAVPTGPPAAAEPESAATESKPTELPATPLPEQESTETREQLLDAPLEPEQIGDEHKDTTSNQED